MGKKSRRRPAKDRKPTDQANAKKPAAEPSASPDGGPALAPDELSRFLCPNPYGCFRSRRSDDGDRLRLRPPPPEVVRMFGEPTAYLPEAAPGWSVALLSRCGCAGRSRLAVRSINVALGPTVPRVVIDSGGMTDVPGVAVNKFGRHPSMFADAMAYASQELGVRGHKEYVLIGNGLRGGLEAMNRTFEVQEG